MRLITVFPSGFMFQNPPLPNQGMQWKAAHTDTYGD
jgi:hypothetical protein